MSTCAANPLPIPLPAAVPPMRAVTVVVLSIDDIEAWLRDEESRLRWLVGRTAARAADLDELRSARVHLDRTLAVLDHLALETEAVEADGEVIGWLHTRSSALVEAVSAALDREALDRAA